MADTNATTDALFTQMAADAGMPTTEAEMQTAWEACNTEAGSPFSNSSEFSPFWRLISAIATRPSQWLLTLLVQHALPNVFLKYSTGACGFLLRQGYPRAWGDGQQVLVQTVYFWTVKPG